MTSGTRSPGTRAVAWLADRPIAHCALPKGNVRRVENAPSAPEAAAVMSVGHDPVHRFPEQVETTRRHADPMTAESFGSRARDETSACAPGRPG